MIQITCLVDNNTLEATHFQSEHGVSFAVQCPSGLVLFDTGQSGDVLLHNSDRLGVDLRQIDALALSHAHYDHTGGLGAFFRHSKPKIHLFAHPEIMRQRFSIKDGVSNSIGLRMNQSELEKYTTLKLSAEATQILPEVWTTGEITQRTEFEGRSAHHYIKADRCWQLDPYRDDMALALVAKTGLLLLCGCCHAGLLNTLAHVRRIFNQEVLAIIGGAHLQNVEPSVLKHAIEVLHASSSGYLPELYLNHCTGEKALATLAQAFGEKVHPCPAGTVLSFE